MTARAVALQISDRPKNLRKPWRLHPGHSYRIDLTFTHFYERVARNNMLVVRSEATNASA